MIATQQQQQREEKAVSSEVDPHTSQGLQQQSDDASNFYFIGILSGIAAIWELFLQIRGIVKSLFVLTPAVLSALIYAILHRNWGDNPYTPVVPYQGELLFLAENYHGGARLRIFPTTKCANKADCLAITEQQPAAGEPFDSDDEAWNFGYWPGDDNGAIADGSVLLALDSVALVARPSKGSVEIWRTSNKGGVVDQLFVKDNANLVATLPRPSVYSRVDDNNPYLSYAVDVVLPQSSEFFGLGQIGWNKGQSSRNATSPPDSGPLNKEGTPDVDPIPIDLARNNRTWPLRSAKYWAAVPFGFTSNGLGVVWNMPGYGNVSIQVSSTAS